MRTIGITGGIGAGKSEVLNYIGSRYRAKIYFADEIAGRMKEPGGECYEALVAMLGEDVLDGDGRIDKEKMAEKIFADRELLSLVNALLHPAVKAFVLREIDRERQKGEADFFVLEAALLLEEHYDAILDELWYVRADQRLRAERLRQRRGYSEEKIKGIMKAQKSDEAFIRSCDVVIDNDKDLRLTYEQIDRKLGEYIVAENK